YGRMRMESEDDLDLDVHVQIRADGHHVGARGWQNVIDRYERARSELTRVVREGPRESLVRVRDEPVVATPYVDYLASRIIELVVHGDDLAYSADLPPPAFTAGTMSVAIG